MFNILLLYTLLQIYHDTNDATTTIDNDITYQLICRHLCSSGFCERLYSAEGFHGPSYQPSIRICCSY